MSKAQLKRLRQKQKAEAEKAAEAERLAKGEAAPAPREEKTEAKKAEVKKEEKKEGKAAAGGKKESKAVLALKEQLRQQKEAEERRLKEEEDRKRAEEEEARRVEEEERKALEDKERRRKDKAEKKEQLRKEGKLLTKGEKEKQRKAQLYLEQLKAQGLPVPDVEHKGQAEAAKRVKYGSRVRKEKKPGKGEAAEVKDGAEAVQEEEKQPDASPEPVEEVTAALAEVALSPPAAGSPEPVVTEKVERDKGGKGAKGGAGKRNKAQLAQLEAQRIREATKADDELRRKERDEEDKRRAAEAAREKAEEEERLQKLQQLEDEAAAMEVEDDGEEEEEEVESWDMDDDEREALRKRKAADRKRKELERQKKETDRKKREAEIVAAKKKLEDEEEAAARMRLISPTGSSTAADLKKTAAAASPTATSPSNASTADEPMEDEDSKEKGPKEKTSKKADKAGSELRNPICCILGHVDTGKTKLLDKIRSSNVQEHEAGGITQQIGATYFPADVIRTKTKEISASLKKELDIRVPGLLVIDTPGHESFSNLRSRGSGLCDIAILVVDIMHGLEPQTLESIGLLKMRKTPFVVALNKIDRCYDWQPTPNGPFRPTLAKQKRGTQDEFDKRAREALTALTEQGLNCSLYYENPDFRKYVSVVPTSAITGEGIPDLLMLLVQLTQSMMNERLSYLSDLEAVVLEVKMVEGHGTTIDVILVNGSLNEGETVVICGLQGPIVTTIRALLTPPAMTELRVKSEYVHHKTVKAAMGVKISAQGLDHAIAGSQLLVYRGGRGPTLEELKDEVQGDLATILSKVDKSGQGVCVQASTLGSLEALLTFLGDMKIPVSGISIGPVYRKDVMRASIMLERRPEYAVILAFDVRVAPEAEKLAAELGVTIFTADIIYHLYDKVTTYMARIKEERRAATADIAVFPVVLDILDGMVFMAKNPLLLGCRVVEGQAKVGTPLCVPAKEKLFIGRITGLQKNHEDVQQAKKGDEVAVKIEMDKGGPNIIVGRQFDPKDQLVSRLTRESIDQLKANFKEDLTDEDWRLVIKLKKIMDIM